MINQYTAGSSSSSVRLADDGVDDFGRVNFLQVTANQHEQRLDNFLFARLKGLPKSLIYKLIRKGEVRVNKGRIKPDYKLQAGDVIRLAPIKLQTRSKPVISESFSKSLLDRVIFETDGFLVIDKPHGLAVHGGSGLNFGLIEALRQAKSMQYLELVHRIDKDTSGLILVAKKRRELKQMQQLFREKRIKKTYQAIVYGVLSGPCQVNQPLERYSLDSGERRVRISDLGKSSQTLIEPVKMLSPQATLISASPVTGRTHQIRVHASFLGHPLLGDDKYHPNDISGAKRLCLHAWQLQVPGYGNFEAPLPLDLTRLIQNLQATATKHGD